ncbi:YicC/YloC family endoribonuclease [Lachnobacterium bovis]|uniref:TIGR00255 family protein n=1 Tax=Lachnobacterium bovis TaxID=140626 RepID=A0A1H9QP27_9FIRM|nr:YicC/YloC family endoribonuclease [Lachnobacterium bovis]SER62212.1 TIGR00255 family protein [Lachnobacterium bovis]
MVKSMTGFGRAEFVDENCRFTIEIKSVNHRYLDINARMPKKFNSLEGKIRNLLKEYVQRGKIDIYITYEDLKENNQALRYNEEMARQYLIYLKQMGETFGVENDIRVSTLSRYPDVFVMEDKETDETMLWPKLEATIRNAAEAFSESRIKEGINLHKDLQEKLMNMQKYVDFIEEKSPEIVKQYKEKIEERIKEILGEGKVDEWKLATEVTLYADKVCVDEEIVRLRSHIKAAIDEMNDETIDDVGRKLNFIAQEMNREATTILSKANNIDISSVGIELKTDIEKVREQIQNIE